MLGFSKMGKTKSKKRFQRELEDAFTTEPVGSMNASIDVPGEELGNVSTNFHWTAVLRADMMFRDAQTMLNVDSQMKSAYFDLDQITQSLNSMQATVLKTKTETPLEQTELIMKKQMQELIELSGRYDSWRNSAS
ncbi:hypothetical protein CAEBREN_19035 [Caenorhabditis brenneri]|uniref:Uncharacterized protein n=1 Tax=Caenorhabditis brenneri TaxID=135651 RepID=G0MLP8_CAEBE|nr:hypothetical protein CAEBREN_19035 [Caenorhabditis brenneri]